jgi:hypothetical protein
MVTRGKAGAGVAKRTTMKVKPNVAEDGRTYFLQEVVSQF